MRYCSSCLSSDRRLLLLRDLLEIAPIIRLLKINFNTDDYICWECEATFNRINTFRLQILKAQKTMKMAFKSKKRKKLKSLSKLCAIKKDSYDEFFTMDDDSKDGLANEDNSGDVEVDFIEDWDGFGYGETGEQFEEEDNTVFTAENEEEDTKPETTTDQKTTEEALAYKVDPVMKLSKQEEQFLVTRMTLEEVHAARDQDRNAPVYKRCPYKCLTCVVGYYQEGKYEKHVGEKHDVTRLHQCAICEVRFTRQDSAEAHHDKHFRRYQCRLCGLSSYKLPVMLAHRASAHGQSVYACDQCDKEFDRPRSLWYHKKQHDEKPKCDICGKTASTKHNLKIHMTLHTGAKRVQCDECGRWVRATSLAAHRRTHGARDEAAYCAPCGLQCASAALYRRHLMRSRAHAPALPRFECSQCDSKYTDKYTLARHVAAKHLKIYPFKCHICNKGFIRKDRVQKHIRERHEGVTKPRDEMCVYCGKGFYERVSLKRHLRIHTGERPYSCRYCGASFGQSSTRNNHVRAIHKDEIELAA